MNILDLLRALFALAFTLGIIGLAAWAARKYAPHLMARLNADRGERRMEVLETLVLDPARRMVLVRVDDEERLLLLGEGKELAEPTPLPPQPQPEPKPAHPESPLRRLAR